MHVELWIIDEASTSANGLIIQVSVALVTLVVNFDELDLSDETENFDNMPYNLISWNSLYELDCVVSLEVSHCAGVFDLTNDPKVCHIEDKLDVDINLVGDFP